MATTAVPAAALQAEREIVAHLRSAGATAPGAAVSLPELTSIGRRRLRRLLDAQVVRPADGGYYLDEGLYTSYRSDRRAAVIGVGVALLALLIAVVLARGAY